MVYLPDTDDPARTRIHSRMPPGQELQPRFENISAGQMRNQLKFPSLDQRLWHLWATIC